MENKKFDYCIMNPPYGNLHLKILNVVSDKVKYEIVNLSPVVNYVSLKNAYSSVHMNKFNKQPLKNKCCNVEVISLNEIWKMFNAAPQNTIGIQHYILINEYDNKPTTYINCDVTLVRKIMTEVMHNSIDKHQKGDYILNISLIHGHVGYNAKDRYLFMSMTWEKQKETKGNFGVGFNTEQDAHDFYDFWMSRYGTQLSKLWRNDLHVYPKFIPYFWAKKGEEKEAIMKKFKLSETEFETLMNM